MIIEEYISRNGIKDLSQEAYTFPRDKEIDEKFVWVLLNEGREMGIKEIEKELIKQFNIPEFALKLRYAKSNEIIFYNKVRFSRLRLVRAGLIEQVKRGIVKIRP